MSGWAGRILNSLGETGIPTGQVVTWLNYNLGVLNLNLDTCFKVTNSGCITPEMNQSDSGVYTEMYYCHYFTKMANQNLGAMAYDSWTEIDGEDQGRIRRTSKNEIAKTYNKMATDCKSNLGELIKWYKDVSIIPRQVTYNSRRNNADSGLRNLGDSYPPAAYVTSGNVVWS